MTTFVSILLFALLLIALPAILLGWATESRHERVRRWRRQGLTQQAIAGLLGCSRSTVGRMLKAA